MRLYMMPVFVACALVSGCVSYGGAIKDNASIERLKVGMTKMQAFSVVDSTMATQRHEDGSSTWTYVAGRYMLGVGSKTERTLRLSFGPDERLTAVQVVDE